MKAPCLQNPDCIDWDDTRNPAVRQSRILDAMESLFSGPASMNDIFRELREERKADREWDALANGEA